MFKWSLYLYDNEFSKFIKNLKTTTAETNIIITKEICGGYGSIGYGYNYENAATWTISDFITKGIESIYNFGKIISHIAMNRPYLIVLQIHVGK